MKEVIEKILKREQAAAAAIEAARLKAGEIVSVARRRAVALKEESRLKVVGEKNALLEAVTARAQERKRRAIELAAQQARDLLRDSRSRCPAIADKVFIGLSQPQET